MKADEFIKQMLSEGYTIPSSIHPFRNGRIDTSKVKDRQEIVDGLLENGESIHLLAGAHVCPSLVPSLLFSSLFYGQSTFSGHWSVSKKWQVLVICNKDTNHKFHHWMLKAGIEDYLLFDSKEVLSHPEVYRAVLKDNRPNVCFVIPNESKAAVLTQFVTDCVAQDIATVISSSEMILRKLPDPAKLLSVEKGKNKNCFIVEQKQHFDSEVVGAFSISSDNDEWRVEAVSTEDVDKTLERGEIGVQPGLSYSDKEVDDE